MSPQPVAAQTGAALAPSMTPSSQTSLLSPAESRALPAKPRIRVAQVITGLALGGGGQVMSTIARNIDRSRFEVDFFCIIEGGAYRQEIEARGFNVIVVPGYDHRRLPRYRAGGIVRLARCLREGCYDIVHTHLFQADVVGRLAAMLAGRPHIVRTLHNLGTWKRLRHRLVDNLLSWRTEKVICVSEHLRQVTIRRERLDPADVVTIQHGVDVNRFRVIADRERVCRGVGLDPSRRTIGTVGRLIPEKGHQFLLDAAPLILSRHPDAQFLVVGAGPLEGDLRARLRGKPYVDRVSFAGARSDVAEILSVLDVFVFPSVSEAFGIAPAEAMAARCPVACSSLPALEEFVQHERTGLLFPPRDHRALASAVNRLLDDEALAGRLVDCSYAFVSETLSETHMVRSLESLYFDLYGRPLPASRSVSHRFGHE